MKDNGWLDSLPVDWSALRLKRAVRLSSQRETEPDPEAYYIGMENIESWTGRLIKSDAPVFDSGEEPESKSTSNCFAPGAVLFGKLRPYLAKIWLADRSGICSTELLVLETGERVHAGFLAHALRTREFIDAVDGTTFGARMPRADWSAIGNIPIPLPPLAQQRAIADHLDRETRRIDDLIAAKERWLDLLAEKRTAVVHHAVTGGLNRTAPLADSAQPWLGAIPSHWRCERARWLFRERDERIEHDEGELLTVSHLTGVTRRADKDVNMFEAETTEGYKICREGDLAINTLWAWMGAMGVSPLDGIVSPAYNVYTPCAELLGAYVDGLVRLPRFAQEVTRYSKGVWSSRLRLYPEGFFEVFLPVPPLAEQRAIVAHIRTETAKLDALRAATERSLVLLRERRAALVAEAVTGRLSLR